MIIGVEGGIWYEYKNEGNERTPITCQRLARVTRPQPAPTVSPACVYRDTAAPILAISFLGVFSSLLAMLLLIKELVERLI